MPVRENTYGESRRIFVCTVGMLAAPRGGTTGSNYHVTKLSLECNFVIVCWPRVHPSAAKVSDFVRILRPSKPSSDANCHYSGFVS